MSSRPTTENTQSMLDMLYSEQDAETKVIVPALQKRGYDETDAKKHVMLKFRYPIVVNQGRERKTIFADIVVFVNQTPLIVIDAKNPRQYLTDNDREQVISYARLIGDIAPYSA
jgi:type I site-specific restriction endonuclease